VGHVLAQIHFLCRPERSLCFLVHGPNLRDKDGWWLVHVAKNDYGYLVHLYI
jgi:hypothetical protein